jgi:hypothetical protein
VSQRIHWKLALPFSLLVYYTSSVWKYWLFSVYYGTTIRVYRGSHKIYLQMMDAAATTEGRFFAIQVFLYSEVFRGFLSF